MDKEQQKAAQAREAALKGALTQIERQFGQGSIMKMGDDAYQVKVAAIPTGALSLDLALGVGGVPRGRIVEVFWRSTPWPRSRPRPSWRARWATRRWASRRA